MASCDFSFDPVTDGNNRLAIDTQNSSAVSSDEGFVKESSKDQGIGNDSNSGNESGQDSDNESNKISENESDNGFRNEGDGDSEIEDDEESSNEYDEDVDNDNEDEDEDEDEDEYYSISDYEAINANQVAMTNLVSLPSSTGRAAHSPGLHAAIVRSPALIQSTITSYFFTLKPKEVRAIWHSQYQRWTYRTNNPPNTIPITALRHLARRKNIPVVINGIKEAPLLSKDLKPYPYFDYKYDTLVLEYNRCGNRPGDEQQHTFAISQAISALHDSPVACRDLKFLRIVYCPTDTKACEIVDKLGDKLKALEQVTLGNHYHYSAKSARFGVTYDNDRAMMLDEVDGHKLEDYPFKVTLQDMDGDELR